MSRENVKKKAVIIGAGFVGSSVAYALTLRNIANEIVLVDIDRDKAEGESLDIRHGMPDIGDTIVRAGGYSDCADCGLIIITAGVGRKPGQSRRDLTAENIGIMRGVIESIKPYYAGSVIFPEAFRDIDFAAKAEEVFNVMIGTDYLGVLEENGLSFGPVKIGE